MAALAVARQSDHVATLLRRQALVRRSAEVYLVAAACLAVACFFAGLVVLGALRSAAFTTGFIAIR